MKEYPQNDSPLQWEAISYQLEDRILTLVDIKNAEEFFEKLIEKGPNAAEVKDERIPYWTEIWPSALGMASYLLKNPKELQGKTIVEIGCGMGLPGMVGAMLGCKVLLTDYIADARSAAKLLWELNGLAPPLWQTMDWRNPDPAIQGDVLLASDVIYEARNYYPLLGAIPKLLNKEGYTLLSEPRRAYSQDFFQQIPSDINCHKVHSKFLSWKEKTYEIDVYKIKPRDENVSLTEEINKQ
ncbi:MAG: hypothetical protein AAF694_13430 [Bacteroidota bacterium]